MPSGVKKKRPAKGTKTKARRPGGGHVFRQQGAVRARGPKAQLRHVKWKDVELERLNRPQQVLKFETVANGVDLAELGVSLKKGGLYRARAAGREIVFRVAKFARPGTVPLLSRLVPL